MSLNRENQEEVGCFRYMRVNLAGNETVEAEVSHGLGEKVTSWAH